MSETKCSFHAAKEETIQLRFHFLVQMIVLAVWPVKGRKAKESHWKCEDVVRIAALLRDVGCRQTHSLLGPTQTAFSKFNRSELPPAIRSASGQRKAARHGAANASMHESV